MESCGTTMKVIRTIVYRELIFFTTQLETSTSNTIAVAANEGRKEGLWRIDAGIDIVVCLNHIGVLAIAIGHHDSDNSTTVVGNRHFITLNVAQEEKICLLSINFLLKIGGIKTAKCLSFHCCID